MIERQVVRARRFWLTFKHWIDSGQEPFTGFSPNIRKIDAAGVFVFAASQFLFVGFEIGRFTK